MQKSLRVISFNIQNRLGESRAVRNTRMGKIASLIKEQSPDLVCLQEVLITDHEILQDQLAVSDAAFVPREDGERLGEGSPIYCLGEGWHIEERQHFWLSNTPHQPSISWKAKHRRIATVAQLAHPKFAKGLWLVNLHLDHASHLARREALKLVRRQLARWRIDTSTPLLVCGDFNMRPAGLAVTGFLLNTAQGANEYALYDSALANEHKAVESTFLGWGRFKLFSARLDYCLHSSQLQCVNYDTLNPMSNGEWLSDHRLVLADYQLKRGELLS
ncbi:MAG: endonuclease/exonuclease/phosphatase family protein [Puniceicoccales bacterium]